MSDLATAKKNEFGKRVLGDEKWAEREAAKRADGKGGVRFGRRVVDLEEEETAPAEGEQPKAKVAKPKPSTTADSPFQGDTAVPIEEMEKMLTERPELFDDAYQREVMLSTPRKGALKLLLRLERAKPEPRATVLKVLEGLQG